VGAIGAAKRIDNWSVTSLEQRVVETGGRSVKPARYFWLLLAESHLTPWLFVSMVRRIVALPAPAGQASRRPEQIWVTRDVRGKVLEEFFGRRQLGGFGTF
jgi:hypothetical protein